MTVINNANESKKNSIEQIEIEVTQKMKPGFNPKGIKAGIPKLNTTNLTKNIFGKTSSGEQVEEAKTPVREEARENKFSQDNISKNIDFRQINTSPLVKRVPDTKPKNNNIITNLKPTVVDKKEVI